MFSPYSVTHKISVILAHDLFTSPNGAFGGRKFCGTTEWPVVIVRVAESAPDPAVWSQVSLD